MTNPGYMVHEDCSMINVGGKLDSFKYAGVHCCFLQQCMSSYLLSLSFLTHMHCRDLTEPLVIIKTLIY